MDGVRVGWCDEPLNRLCPKISLITIRNVGYGRRGGGWAATSGLRVPLLDVKAHATLPTSLTFLLPCYLILPYLILPCLALLYLTLPPPPELHNFSAMANSSSTGTRANYKQ